MSPDWLMTVSFLPDSFLRYVSIQPPSYLGVSLFYHAAVALFIDANLLGFDEAPALKEPTLLLLRRRLPETTFPPYGD